MVNSLSGSWTVIFACGTFNRESPPVDSVDTPRTSCLLLSPVTTDRLSQLPVTRPSNCGTPSDSANTPLLKMVTPTGFHAFSYHQTPTPQSLFQAVGIRL